jgi:hypothetical protein
MQDQLFDFLVGKDIRRSAIALSAEDIIRWDFMTRVSRPRKSREANQNLFSALTSPARRPRRAINNKMARSLAPSGED